MLTIHCGQAAVAAGGGRVAEHEDVRRDQDEEKSQGWTALILDTNGNGKRDEYVEPDQPINPAKDKRINAAFYGVTVSPVDGSIWGTVLGFPGAVVRLTLDQIPRQRLLQKSTNYPGPIQTLLFTDSRRAGSTLIAMVLCGR